MVSAARAMRLQTTYQVRVNIMFILLLGMDRAWTCLIRRIKLATVTGGTLHRMMLLQEEEEEEGGLDRLTMVAYFAGKKGMMHSHSSVEAKDENL
jgi:hypothetical protein